MIYLAANNSRVWKFRQDGYSMGWMMSPKGWRRPIKAGVSMPFALDNGLFHDPKKQPKGMKALPPFYAMLDKCVRGGWSPLFVTVPDVPYDGAASRQISAKHRRHLRAEYPGLRLAVAIQDGMEEADLDGYDACFPSRFDRIQVAERGAVHACGSCSWHVDARRPSQHDRPGTTMHRR